MNLNTVPRAAPRADRLGLLFAALATLIALSFIAVYSMGVYVVDKEAEFAATHAFIAQLRTSISTVKDAETGQRGFLLTDDPAYLEPYHDAVVRVPAELRSLAREVGRGRLHTEELENLVELVDDKFAELAETIALARSGDIAAARDIVRSNHGSALMSAIRDLAASIESRELLTAAELQKSVNNATFARTTIAASLALLLLIFIAWVYHRITSEMNARNAAVIDASEQRDLLSTTLASIGDAVIVTDRSGHVTFLNDVARELTAWRDDAAIGRPCGEVFNIINEETRKPVASPVDLVLRDGRIVGLANHTILIARNGREIPIDDSGAPVRDRDGTITGVVLVFRDFTERKNYERDMVETNRRLEAANRAKDNFLANLSHELRTPLTPVIATLSMWEVSNELPPTLRDDVEMLRRNLELEARLIDDLLDLTRIAEGKMRVTLEVVDVHEVIASVMEMFASEMHTKGIEFLLRLEAVRHHAPADPVRLQQVLLNLIKNATKFTAAPGRIVVSTIDDQDNRLHIEVADTGIGMSQEMLDRLFVPFEQGDDLLVRNAGGLGLGLALCKAFVRAQGGEISAHSDGEGKGSTLRISLPLVQPQVTLETVDDDAADGMKPARDPRPRRLDILLIEDHADTAAAMKRLIESLGHRVQAAANGAAALELVAEHEFDLVVSDIGLPDGNGYELLPKLREQRSIRAAIALTGFGQEEDLNRSAAAGFDFHLTKPVNFQRLSSMIRRTAESRDTASA